MFFKQCYLVLAVVVSQSAFCCFAFAEPLASWNDGPAKRSILRFVARVTNTKHPDFVPPAERIAVFDNDGTLWSEQPIYFQLAFALDRLKRLAPQHPEWRDSKTLRAAIAGDMKAVLAQGEHGILEIVMATHAGTTTEEFEQAVREWTAKAKHPKTGRRYIDMVYQPMLELLVYLRANEFKTWIVSGGGIEFMRPWSQQVYGIPPEQVVGSSITVRYELRGGKPTLVRLAEMDFIDDKAGKPVGIHKFIGRRPIAAFGNSDGDLQMIQWTTAGNGARLGAIIHHTDAEREFAYDRKSAVGRLDRAMKEAKENGWTIVDMKAEWKTIYPTR